MAAHKGHVKAGGRAKGTLNKVTSDIKELARVHGPAAIERLAELAFGDVIPESAAVDQLRDMVGDGVKPSEIAKFARSAFAIKSEGTCTAAIRELLDRGYGKAPQPHDGDGQGGAMTLIVRTGVPRAND